jgi:hypothetical protein
MDNGNMIVPLNHKDYYFNPGLYSFFFEKIKIKFQKFKSTKEFKF